MKKAVDNFIAENLRFSKFRGMAYDRAMSRKDYPESKRLCIDALSSGDHHHGASPWLYKLYDLYETTRDAAKMAETTQIILLCGDVKYYDTLKSLLKEKKWKPPYFSSK